MNVTEGNRCYDDGKTTENRELFLLITFSFYVFEGFILVIFNGLLELILLKHRDLRRHYVIIFAQVIKIINIRLFDLAIFLTLIFHTYRLFRMHCWELDFLQPEAVA